jgi:transcriptional regulator with XRE-family HTH domain
MKGITQSEIARKTGFTQPQISDYLNGKKIPGERNLRLLAESMDMNEYDLIRMLIQRRAERKGNKTLLA